MGVRLDLDYFASQCLDVQVEHLSGWNNHDAVVFGVVFNEYLVLYRGVE